MFSTGSQNGVSVLLCIFKLTSAVTRIRVNGMLSPFSVLYVFMDSDCHIES